MKGSTAQAANDSVRAELRTVVDNRPTGEFLKAARLARDEDLQTVAQNLRIRRPYLEAIENGEPQNLPGSTYAIGFVRAYAEYLDLDANDIVARFKAEAQTHEEQTQLLFPEPMPGSRVPSGAIILVALLLIAGAYGGWMYLSGEDRTLAGLAPPVPESLLSLIYSTPAPVEPTVDGTAAPAAPDVQQGAAEAADATPVPAGQSPAGQSPAGQSDEPAATAAPVQDPAPAAPVGGVSEPGEPPLPEAAPVESVVADTVADEPAPARVSDVGEIARAIEPEATRQATETQVRPPAPPAEERAAAVAEGVSAAIDEGADVAAVDEAMVIPDPPTPDIPRAGGNGATTVYGAQDEPSRVLIRARQPSWVEITGGDGEVLLTRLLRKGDTYRVPDRPGIRLVTGNAGGLEFEVDGAAAPDIGPVGSVRRNVLLEPEALSSGRAGAAGDG